MRILRSYGLWAAAGVLTAVVLVALAWLFMIGPQYSQARQMNKDAAVATERTASMRRLLNRLASENAELPRYQAQAMADRRALPASAGMADFLRELQKAGDGTGLTIKGMSVGATTHRSVKGTEVYAFPITLTAAGTGEEWDRFLDRLQLRQPRAVLINSVSVRPRDEKGASSAEADLTLGLQVFTTPSTVPSTPPSTAPSPAPSG